MFIGFDYGMVNCLVVSMQDGRFVLILFEGDSFYIFLIFVVFMCELVFEYLFCYCYIVLVDVFGE